MKKENKVFMLNKTKKNTPVCLSSLELLSNTIFGMRLHITQHKKNIISCIVYSNIEQNRKKNHKTNRRQKKNRCYESLSQYSKESHFNTMFKHKICN